jgi:hypothetical protein
MFVFALISASSPALFAQSGDADAQFQKGRELLASGKVAEACDAFETSEKLDPALTTQLALGVCREKNQQLATAWKLFNDVARRAAAATDETGKQIARAALADAAKLEPRLSKITISVAPAARIAGLEIKKRDVVVAADAWNQAVPSDGGTIEISARAPGHQGWSTKISVRPEGDRQAVDVPALAAEVVVHAAPPPQRSQAAVETPTRSRTLPIVLGIGALALGGGAIAFTVAGSHTYDQATREADDAKQLTLWHSANTKRYLAEGFGIAAIGCAGAAVWLFVRGGRDDSRVGVVPIVSGDRTALALEGRF